MRFRLLGALSIERNGRAVHLHGGRPRAVLALLLLNPGVLVPVERLVDAVWGHSPPRTVRAQVHAQISVIRRCLLALPDVELRTHTAGYLLRVDPGDIDVAVFRKLARQGGTLAATGQPSAAAEAFQAALGMHVGPPLGDIDAPFARAAASRLVEERLGVLAALSALELRAGRHHELIPKLTSLVEQHPLHEPLWRYLLMALHRAGRRSEAITQYHRARAVLRDELGVDPGPELTLAYRALLDEAPSGDRRGDDGLGRALSRLAEIEHMLREIRRQLEAGGLNH